MKFWVHGSSSVSSRFVGKEGTDWEGGVYKVRREESSLRISVEFLFSLIVMLSLFNITSAPAFSGIYGILHGLPVQTSKM